MADQPTAPVPTDELNKSTFAQLGDPQLRITAVLAAKQAGVLHYGEDRRLLGLPANSEGTVLRRLIIRQEQWAQTLRENATTVRTDLTLKPGASINPVPIITAFEQLSDEIAGWSKQAREDTEIWD